jgi:hypothetical protein
MNRLIDDLRRRGVVLTACGEKLRVDAPAGVLTPDLRTVLAGHKDELLAALRDADPVADPYEVPAGWTRRSWIERLRFLARVCVNPRRSAELTEWADGLEYNGGESSRRRNI